MKIARYGPAALMVIAPLSLALGGVLFPYPTIRGHDPQGYLALAWFSQIWLLTLAPAVIGVGVVAMRGAPLLGALGLVLTVPGTLNADGNPYDLVYAGVREGVPVATLERMMERVYELPAYSPAGVWLYGVAFGAGALLLGVALLVGRSAPWWAGFALVASAVVAMLGAWVELPDVARPIGWTLATAAFAGCAVSLVRHHPTSAARRSSPPTVEEPSGA
ncbi:hypothetical protein [Thermoactinospora rubra]|uniref:hypothetical protein n=1 Tax=Thermoactinospora rubra TaxID=1088767 RepID=UPI000A0F5512|nr:hypothetical protein [Thermoactinospora rubra]